MVTCGRTVVSMIVTCVMPILAGELMVMRPADRRFDGALGAEAVGVAEDVRHWDRKRVQQLAIVKALSQNRQSCRA